MVEKTIVCDRCSAVVQGIETETATGGFYKRIGWAKYMNDRENNVCDKCMQSDERYLKDYPR